MNECKQQENKHATMNASSVHRMNSLVGWLAGLAGCVGCVGCVVLCWLVVLAVLAALAVLLRISRLSLCLPDKVHSLTVPKWPKIS